MMGTRSFQSPTRGVWGVSVRAFAMIPFLELFSVHRGTHTSNELSKTLAMFSSFDLSSCGGRARLLHWWLRAGRKRIQLRIPWCVVFGIPKAATDLICRHRACPVPLPNASCAALRALLFGAASSCQS